MRKLVTAIALLGCLSYVNAQQEDQREISTSYTYNSVSLSVTVDSLEEIDTTFKLEDLTSLLQETGSNETLSFKIICNGEPMSSGIKSHMSYKVSGNSDEPEEFVKSVEKVIESAKKYYSKQ